MAHHKSALKRIKQNAKRQERNKAVRTRVKNVVKNVRVAAANEDENIQVVLNDAISNIAKAASKGVIPARRANRKISRLTKLVNKSAPATT